MEDDRRGYTWVVLAAFLSLVALQAAVAVLLFGTSAIDRRRSEP